MSEVELQAKIAFLLQPSSQALLQALCADPRDDLSLSASPALRGLPVQQRAALLEQRKLRAKALRKRPEAPGMIFTPLGLEQMTHHELAAYKASRLPGSLASLADLCCGLGGDSLPVPPRVRVVGLDRSRGTLLAYRHNVSLLRPAAAVEADVASPTLRAEAACIDPARRAAGRSGRWQDEDLSPGWAELEKLIARYGNMWVKLGPGISFPDFLEPYEWEYLGLRDECLEAVVWTGALGRPGMVRAVELPGGAFVEALRADVPDSFGDPAAPGGFLFEPVKSVVRAHLFGVLASRHGLWPIDARIAYLSGDKPVRDPLLKSYRIERELPFDPKAIKEFLRKEDVGRLEIKKRGVNLIPEEFRAGLRLAGPNSGTLFFTRVLDRKTAFWARRLEGGAEGEGGAEED
jgi:hypothetical protein